MLAKLFQILKAIFGAASVATNPVKGIATIAVSMLIPYLLYAFLGGAALVLIIVGIIALVWWLAKRNKK